MRKLGIVIVNYNGAKFQNACVDSILQSDYDDFYIATKVEAEEQIQTAKELVKLVEEYVQKRWAQEE